MLLPRYASRGEVLRLLMNGVPLEKMDEIINPVCFLCREHERSGFVHGVRIGMLLARELAE